MSDSTRQAEQRPPGASRSRQLAILLTGVVLLCATVALAAETPVPPAPDRWATDTAQFVSESTRAELDKRLQAHETATGQQILLWIGRTTGNASIEEWTARTYAAWRVGRKGLDDGVVLFLMADDRKVRIEVGYGLEDRLTDARAATIIRDQIVPRLREGDRDGAARAGIDDILRVLGSPQTAMGEPAADQRRPAPGLAQLIIMGIVGLLLLGFVITHPRLAILLLTNMGSGRGGGFGGGRGGGFGGGGGGGFSGGGGRSGGGGASGSW